MSTLQRKHSLEDSVVLAALEDARHPLSVADLVRRLRLKSSDRPALKKCLSHLIRKDQVAEVRSGRYMPAGRKRKQESRTQSGPSLAQDLVRGRLTMHRDGYGFVIPAEPIPGIEGDVFIPPKAAGDAMHGDRVRVRIRRRGRGGKVEGAIVEVEERARTTVVGLLRYGTGESFVTPYEQRLQYDIVIPKGKAQPPGEKLSRRVLDGAVVNVEITHYPKGGGRMQGRVLEVLGQPGDFGIDVEIMIRKYQLPNQFGNDVVAEARKVPAQPLPEETGRRRDFRHLPIVTIDGETAKDFDDAVRVARMENGHYMLHVHIADVAHYVHTGSALDREARLRGTSVYFPDRAVPMLPEKLSNGVCSLRPGEERLVMSCLMAINQQGEVVRYWVGEGIIRSAARMTYTAVNAILEGKPAALERYRALVPEFERMRELALILNDKRERRGSIDFDLPDPVIQFDENGRMTGITRSERNIANRIIEEFMLAANETVARFLEEQRVASLHRVHDKPEPRKVLAFEEIAATFGYSFGLSGKTVRPVRVKERDGRGRGRSGRALEVPEKIDITPFHYQRLTERIAGRPEERILSFLMLRSLKQAVYSEEARGHFALATPYYAHFTSPIRRYPDLIVHRLLKWSLKEVKAFQEGALFYEGTFGDEEPKKKGKQRGLLTAEQLQAIAVESSEAERRAEEAERELIEVKKLEYMQQHLGDEFEGLVINAARFGFWVELMDMFVEGVVPMETLDSAADYHFREATRSLVPGRRSSTKGAPAFHLGDRVRVRVDRIDVMRKQVQFSVLEGH